MKLIVLFLAFSLHVSAAVYAQKITLSFKNASLETVLDALNEQGYNYFTDDNDLNKANPVTLNLKSATIETTLLHIFKNQPFDYQLNGKLIKISYKEPSKKNENPPVQQLQVTLSGKVIDENGQPLIGATVISKELNRGTATDDQGRFSFSGAPESGTLAVTFLGFESRDLKYRNGKVADIVLKEINTDLSTVQVIAYGTVNKKYSTTNVGTVPAEEIARQPVNNPLLALQGRVPGLFIASTTGNPGASVKVQIQGQNTFRTEGQSPLYVVDGVPYAQNFTNLSLSSAVGNGGSGGSTLNFINPADIESISVLKDADATAIYGSRAANGAILITTKKGKAGKTKVEFNLQQGRAQIARRYDYLNTQQYLEIRKEAYANVGAALPTVPANGNYDLTVWDQNRYTDWQEELVGNTAHFTDLRSSVSGGNQNTQFLIGYGYNRQTTVYPNSLADQKANVHFNINHSSTDGKFNVMLNASYLYDHNRLNGGDLMVDAVRLAPNAPALYKADGTLNFEPLPGNPNSYSFSNPMTTSLQPYTGITGNLTANNNISYEIIPGLQLKTTMGYNKLQGDESRLTPLSSLKPDAFNRTRSATFLNKSISTWIIEPQATFLKNTSFGIFDALLGGTLQQTNTNALQQTGSNYSNDNQLGSLQAAPIISIDNVVNTKYKYNAFFGRLNYRLQNKYVINLTARRDGTSRFGDENKFHTFYSVGGAWLFAEEAFGKSLLPWLSTGKLRANYGTTGNDQIPDYLFLSLLANYNVNQPYLGVGALYPTNIANPYLQWEETRKLNIGIDLGFFNDRLEVSANYFRNRSSNQLLTPQIPIITGFGSVTKNLPATIQNTGLELTLTATPVRNSDFSWQTSFNVTVPKNKLVAYPGLATSTDANTYFIGEPVNIVQRYKFAGVNPETGGYEFYNSKGEIVTSPSTLTDRISRFDPNPTYYGGFTNTITYKGFQLDFLFQGVKQMGDDYRFGNLPGSNINQPITVLERWQKKGDIAPIQKMIDGFADFNIAFRYYTVTASDANYSDASYIRLKNAALSYTVKNEWLKKAHISSARIFMQGQNLLTISNYQGTDPETRSPGTLPPLKVFTLGAQFSF